MNIRPEDDLLAYNRRAWNRQVDEGNRWTRPVSADEISEARKGSFQIVLTPSKPVPMNWFPPLAGCKVLCLAGGGGQQAPILAAAGGIVTVFDNSERQLDQDRLVAQRENLSIRTIQGDMADLSELDSGSFDLIFHPCSNTFVPDVIPVWKEAARVLCPGGVMLSGFCNPLAFIFDYEQSKKGVLEVRHAIPYSDSKSLSQEEQQELIDAGEPFCFAHTLEDQIRGQTSAGFAITDLFEDYWNDPKEPLDRYIASFIATRAVKQ